MDTDTYLLALRLSSFTYTTLTFPRFWSAVSCARSHYGTIPTWVSPRSFRSPFASLTSSVFLGFSLLPFLSVRFTQSYLATFHFLSVLLFSSSYFLPLLWLLSLPLASFDLSQHLLTVLSFKCFPRLLPVHFPLLLASPLVSPAIFGYPRLPSAILSHPRLPSVALGYPRLPSAILGCPRLSSVALGCSRLPSVALSCPRLPSVALGCSRLPSVAHGCSRLLSAALGCFDLP